MKIKSLFKKVRQNYIYYFYLLILFTVIYFIVSSLKLNREGLDNNTKCKPKENYKIDLINNFISNMSKSTLTNNVKNDIRDHVKVYSENSDIIKNYLFSSINDLNKNVDCSGNELMPVKTGDFINNLDTCLSKIIDLIDDINLVKTKNSIKKMLEKILI